MTSRERLLAAMRRQPTDHVPFSPHIWQGPVVSGPLYWRNQFERAERLLEMGVDPIIEFYLPDAFPHRDVEIKTWRDTSGPEPMMTKEYHTPAGVLRQTVRETDDWCDPSHSHWIPTTFGGEIRSHFNMELFDDHNVSRRTEPWVKGPEDLEKLRYLIRLPEGHLLDEWRMDAERAMEIAAKHDVMVMARRTIVADAFQWFCDIPDFMCWMIESPEFVTEFLSIFEEWAMKQTELALEVGVDVVQHRGWYDIPNYWGVKYWEQYIAPFIVKQAEMVHDAGKLYSYLLPEGHGIYASVLHEMPIDVLQGVDPRMLHKGDMRSLFDQLGDNKCFWGGISTEVTLASQDPEQIDAAVKEAIESLGGNNGLVLSAIMSRFIPQDSILYMVDAWKKHRSRVPAAL